MAKSPATAPAVNTFVSDGLYNVVLSRIVRWRGRVFRPDTEIKMTGKVLNQPQFAAAIKTAVELPPNSAAGSTGESQSGGA